MTLNENCIVYDGDCPFCSSYVSLVKLRENIGQINLVNARDRADLVSEFSSLGYDLDEGMILVWDGQIFYGDECVTKIALLSTSSTVFNRVNKFIFEKPLLAKIMYPILKTGRKIYLRIRGIRKINHSQQN